MDMTTSNVLIAIAVFVWALVWGAHIRETRKLSFDTEDVIILVLLALYFR